MEDTVYSRITNNRDAKLPVVIQATMDVFFSAISVPEHYQRLLQACGRDNGAAALSTLAAQFLSAGPHDALWCPLLLQYQPPAEVAGLINIVHKVMAGAVSVPTGLRLKDASYGNSHIVRDKSLECRGISKVAMRLLLVAAAKWFQDNNLLLAAAGREGREGACLQCREALMHLCRQQLALEDDAMSIILAAKAIAHGIPVDIFAPGPAELLVQNLRFSQFFLGPFYAQLTATLQTFFVQKRAVRISEQELQTKEEELKDLDFAFHGVLYAETGFDREEDLPVPLVTYLKDSEPLNTAYTLLTKGIDKLAACRTAYLAANTSVFVTYPCCRLLFVLCSIMTHTMVMERARGALNGTADNEEERAACSFLTAFDWRRVVAFGQFERKVSDCLLSRLFMTCAARSFPALQNIFCKDGVIVPEDSDEEATSIPCPVHLAMRDLTSPALDWFPPRERDVAEDVLLPLEDVVLRRQIRLPTLDTRISTALCRWAVVFNAPAQRRMLAWRGGTSSTPAPTPTPTSQHYWKQLVYKSHSLSPAPSKMPPKGGESPEDESYSGQPDRDASLVLFIRSEPMPPNCDALFETSRICDRTQSCAHFAEYHAFLMADAFLSFSTLEGSCCLHRRGLHPLDIVSLLLQQAPPEAIRLAGLHDQIQPFCACLVGIARAEQDKPPLKVYPFTLILACRLSAEFTVMINHN